MRRFSLLALLVALLTVDTSPAVASDVELEQTVLAGDWAEVAAILGKDDARAKDPVARLLMGHASLALNRNNAAALLFRSMGKAEDLAAWKSWTSDLAQRHPQRPVALYLAGDAKARLGRYDEAITTFTRALELEPAIAGLALNARGIVHIMRGSWDSAQIDLFNVTQLAPGLADGYASLGALAVLRGASLAVSREALDPFKRALDLDPAFALAYNGRGCILFGSGRFAEAAADFETAADLLPTLVVADLNAGHATTYAASVAILAKIDAKPGTTLQTRVTVVEERVRALRQEVAKLMPDPVFWDQIKRFPELSPEQVAGLKEKYGPDKVQMAIWVTKESILPRNRELNLDSQFLVKEMGVHAGAFVGFAVAEKLFSGAITAYGAGSKLQKYGGVHGWAAHRGPIELGAKISAAVINKPLVDAVVTTLMPGALLWKTLALGTKWTFKAGKHVAEESMEAVAAQHMAVNKEAAANAWRYRAYQAAYSQAFHPTPEPRSSFPTSPFSAVDGLPDRITRQPPLPTLRRPCDISQPCTDSLSRGADFTRFAPPPPPAAFPSSKSGPGGVDTAQLALTYVEKQGRPVTTVFTLNYLPMVGGGG